MTRAGLDGALSPFSTCLDAIAAREHQVRAFTDGGFDRDLVEREAADLLRRYPDPEQRPPLFGVPLGVKDIFRVDGRAIRCGSALPPEVFAGRQAEAVTRLKAAGALVMGITVSAEFACWAPGPTRNPCNLSHTPGGSSSGSAAGVAAGFFALALGSQTAGSVIRPAAYCGVVGVKPSFGRVGRDGMIPYAVSLDHVGLMADSVDRAEGAMAALCDDWRRAPQPAPADIVLGVASGPYLQNATARARSVFEATVDSLRHAGFTVRDVLLFEDVDEVNDSLSRLSKAEVAVVHREWSARYGELYHPTTMTEVRAGRALPVGEAERLRAMQARTARRVGQITAEAGIDIWLSPAAPDRAPAGLEATGDPVMNSPWIFVGWPTLTLPCAIDGDGLTYGLQIAAPNGCDEMLFAAAATIESVIAP